MKLAPKLTQDLITHIESGNLAVGDLIGSEADITARLGVSRWSAREALNILEREGRIAIKRGRYGGIFVAQPSTSALSLSIGTYLEFNRVTAEQILSVRAILDELVLRLAVDRVSAQDIPQLRAVGDLQSEEDGLRSAFVQYDALLKAANNTVLTTLIQSIGQLGMGAIARSTLSDEALAESMKTSRIHRRKQIEAVISGDLSSALDAEKVILDCARAMLQSAQPQQAQDSEQSRLRAVQMFSAARRFKRSELLIHEIVSDIVASGWPIGVRLGAESDLLERYNVSRSTFREAVRTLERIGVAAMKTGRNSGLTVISPNPKSVIDAAAKQLAKLHVASHEVDEVFYPLAARMIASLDPADYEPGDCATPSGTNLRQLVMQIGEQSGNEIFAMFVDLLTHADVFERPGNDAQSQTILPQLLQALDQADPAAAARHMLALRPA